MELDVSKAFLSPGAEFPFEGMVSIAPQDVTGETVTFDEVSICGTFMVLEEKVHLRGTLETVAHGDCVMCMEKAAVPVHVSFMETFRKDANEMEEEDFSFNGKAVSLDQMTLTLVMLNLPMRFLCREDCRGSGELQAWQNESSPGSQEESTSVQHPFAALQSLLMKDEEV